MVEKILQYVRSLAVHKIHVDNQLRDDPMQLHCTFRQKLNPNKQASAEKIKTKLQQSPSVYHSSYLHFACLRFRFLGKSKNHVKTKNNVVKAT